jgi:hypothetical protein
LAQLSDPRVLVDLAADGRPPNCRVDADPRALRSGYPRVRKQRTQGNERTVLFFAVSHSVRAGRTERIVRCGCMR